MTISLEKYKEISGLLDKTELEKVALFAYFGSRSGQCVEFGANEIRQWFADAHLHKLNMARLMKKISGSASFAKGSRNGHFKLHAAELRVLDEQLGEYFETESIPILKSNFVNYVHDDRIMQLEGLKSERYDFKKLITLCNELNLAHAGSAVYSCAMLLRAILDHVPPIFGCQNFAEVANNYGSGRSFKKSMKNLHTSLRNIADQHLHTPIRRKEVVPTVTQVDFSNDLDLLLSEVVRILD